MDVLLRAPLPGTGIPGILSARKPHTGISASAGQEPYRKLGLKVYEQPQISAEECKVVLATQDQYWKYYQEVCMQCSLPLGRHLIRRCITHPVEHAMIWQLFNAQPRSRPCAVPLALADMFRFSPCHDCISQGTQKGVLVCSLLMRAQGYTDTKEYCCTRGKDKRGGSLGRGWGKDPDGKTLSRRRTSRPGQGTAHLYGSLC